ncbi:MAG: T9SS type A sorting domain-containing protein [Candidatus Kapaibacteriales bacterium]
MSKKRIQNIINIFFAQIFFTLSFLYSQNQSSSFEGTHFFVGFMQNEIAIDPRFGGLHLELFISTITTCDVNIVFPPDSIVTFNSISPNTILQIEVPTKFECYNSEIFEQKAIEIISTAPILVYAFSTQYLTSDGYAAVPVEQWDKEYVVVSYPNDQYLDWQNLSPQDSIYKATPRQSEFMIIAGFDSTQITFFPKAITQSGAQINSPRTITLHRGQCYLVKSFPFPKGYGDLTGTLIQGNKPFGVLSGHVRTAVPQNLVPKWDSKNHLVEMLMPVVSWGREFITVPFATGPRGDLIRIVGYYPNTTIESIWNGGSATYVIDAPRGFVDIPYVAEPRRWIADKPVQIAQFMMRSGTDDDYSNYDPAMTIIPPVEQFVDNINFQTLGNIAWNPNQFIGHYINVVGTIDALDSTTLNNVLIKNLPSNIHILELFGGTHFWANIKLSYGKYKLSTPKGKFSGVIYGAGLADAYAIVLGSSLKNPYVYDSTPPIITFSEDCGDIYATIEDYDEPNRSGIGYVFIIKDSTFNYNYQISQLTEQTLQVTLSAKVIDKTKKAQIIFEGRDRNGNFRRFTHIYEPPLISHPLEILFENVKPYDSISKKFYLVNIGTNISIQDIHLKRKESRLFLYVKDRIPIDLKYSDSTEILVNVSPNGSFNEIYDTLIIATDCNFLIEIPIRIVPFIANLQVIGYDFGKVLVGDTAFGWVEIINLSKDTVVIDSIFISSFPNVFFKQMDLPIKLNSGDTAKYLIFFNPKSRQVYYSNVIFFDELRLKPQARITGEGISPEILSIEIDFGRTRVGRSKDTLVYILNIGSANAKIEFENFDVFNMSFDSLSFIFQDIIPANDSIPVFISFSPNDTGEAITSAIYKVDWKYHQKVSITAKGVGTLPSIKTFNVFLDTIFVDSSITKIAPIIKSVGNEELNIIRINPIFGDFTSFYIDYSSLKDITLPVDSLLSIPVTFSPKFITEHKLALEVVSDASYGWEVNIDTIYIIGYAIPRDTVKASLVFTKNSTLEKLCTEFPINLKVANLGNCSFNITSIFFESENLRFSDIDSILFALPLKLLPQDTFFRKLNVIFPNKGISYLIASVIINDTLKLTDTLRFNVFGLEQTLDIGFPTEKIAVHQYTPLILSGKFIEPSYHSFNYQIILKINFSQIYFDWTQPLSIAFSNANSFWKKEILLQKNGDFLIGNFGDLDLKGETTEWFLSISTFGMFSLENIGVIQVFGVANFCYDTIYAYKEYSFEPVCAQELREIIVDGIEFRSIYPNPTYNQMTLEYFSTQICFAYLKIFDKLGNCVFDKTIEMKKGLNFESFDFSFLPNGIYFLKLQSNHTYKHFILTITK